MIDDPLRCVITVHKLLEEHSYILMLNVIKSVIIHKQVIIN